MVLSAPPGGGRNTKFSADEVVQLGTPAPITALLASRRAGGTPLLWGGAADGHVYTWTLSSWPWPLTQTFQAHSAGVTGLVSLPNLEWVCSSSADGTCRLWLLDSGLTSSASDAPNTALKGDKSSPSKASPFGNKALQGAWLGEKEKGARRISALAYCAERSDCERNHVLMAADSDGISDGISDGLPHQVTSAIMC